EPRALDRAPQAHRGFDRQRDRSRVLQRSQDFEISRVGVRRSLAHAGFVGAAPRFDVLLEREIYAGHLTIIRVAPCGRSIRDELSQRYRRFRACWTRWPSRPRLPPAAP